MIIEPIAGDMPDLRAALAASDLPVDDIDEAGRSFFRFSRGGVTLGFGGFELLGGNVLLRSIVVLPDVRRSGQGKAAAELLMQRARDAGARTAWLLTTDAAPFFERLGFRPVDRSAAPADILATRQAASLCPSTATLMARPI